jgi:hypothetical protein
MKKTGKKVGLITMLLICCLFFSSAPKAEAASAKSRALKAYKTMLSSKTKLSEYVMEAEFTSLSRFTFAIVYIDNNSVPELILNG